MIIILSQVFVQECQVVAVPPTLLSLIMSAWLCRDYYNVIIMLLKCQAEIP